MLENFLDPLFTGESLWFIDRRTTEEKMIAARHKFRRFLQQFRVAGGSVRNNRAGSLIMESLEERRLLAATTTAWHNASMPADVNNDGVIAPNDAFLVARDIRNNGSRPLQTAFASLAFSSTQPSNYIDVNSDGYASPVDVFLVAQAINELRQEDEVLRFRLGIADHEGHPLASQEVDQGQPFQLQVFVDDLREPRNEVQTISLTGSPTGGSFTLSFQGVNTADLPYNVNAETLQGELESLVSIGANNVQVSDSGGGSWAVEFTGAWQQSDVQGLLVGNGTNLTGGTNSAVEVEETPGLSSQILGVASAVLDVTYDPAMVSTTGDITAGDQYLNFLSGDLNTPGLIDEAGGSQSDFFTPVGGNEVLLFSVPFIADVAGSVTFAANAADLVPQHVVFFFSDPTQTIQEDEIDFAGVTLNVLGDDPPLSAMDDEFTIVEDSTNAMLDVLANDEGAGILITETSDPAHGALAVSVSGDQLFYTPDADFFGTDSFTYTISQDGDQDTATVVVTVTAVNDQPVAVLDRFTIVQDSTLEMESNQLTSNDAPGPANESGQELILSAVSATSTAGGNVTLADGTITYAPAPGFIGEDTFTYTVSDDAQPNPLSITGTVAVMVERKDHVQLRLVTSDLDGSPISTVSIGNPFLLQAFVQDVRTNTDELQVVSLTGNPDGGTFTLTFDGQTTEAIPFDASNQDLVLALEALANIEPGDVRVSPTQGSPWQVIFQGNLSGQDVPALVGDGSGLTGGTNPEVATETIETFGVAQASLDISYNDGLASTTGPIDFGDAFETLTGGQLLPGQIDEAGAVQTNFGLQPPFEGPLGRDEVLLFTVPFVADASGSLTFESGPADTEILLFFESVVVPTDKVDYLSATIDIPMLQAVNDAFTVLEDSNATNPQNSFDVLANDINENTDLTIDSVDLVIHNTKGTVSINRSGTPNDPADDRIIYQPPTDFFGEDKFVYTIVAGESQATATVDVSVTNTNDPPRANDDEFRVVVDSVDNRLDILSNDVSDPDPANENVLLEGIEQYPDHGMVVIKMNGTLERDDDFIQYTPDTGFEGVDTFVYSVSDGSSTGIDLATVTVNVGEVALVQFRVDTVNADNESIAWAGVDDDFALEVYVQDLRVREDVIVNELQEVRVTGEPTAGFFTLAFSQNGVSETTDPIAYDASAEQVQAALEALTAIGVGNVAVSGTSSGAYLVKFTGTLGLSDQLLLTGDSDQLSGGADPIVIKVMERVLGVGTAFLDVLFETSSIALVSPAGEIEFGSEFSSDFSSGSITATEIDEVGAFQTGFGLNTGPVGADEVLLFRVPFKTLAIGEQVFTTNAADDVPDHDTVFFHVDGQTVPAANILYKSTVLGILATTDDQFTVDEDSVHNSLDVFANDAFAAGSRTIAISQLPANGVAEVDLMDVNDPDDDVIRYTPDADYFGNDSFRYSVSDASGLPLEALVSLTVSGINDSPVPLPDSVLVKKNGSEVFGVAIFLANDSPGPNEETTQTLVIFAVGSLSREGGALVFDDQGTPDPSDDVIGYTPPTDFEGTDEFTYMVEDDGTAPDRLTATTTVTVNVAVINTPPLPIDDAMQTLEDIPLTFAASELLANDAAGLDDEVDQVLTVTDVSASSDQGGTVTISEGTVSYTPPINFVGTDTFQYTVTDNGQSNGQPDPQSAVGMVTVAIAKVNDRPVATDDAGFIVVDNQVLTIDVDNLTDNDVPGPSNESTQTVTIFDVSLSSSRGGSVVRNPDGTITYDPPATDTEEFFGIDVFEDTFMYRVIDDGNSYAEDNGQFVEIVDPRISSEATVTVTVQIGNRPPIADDDTYRVDIDGSNSPLRVLLNDADPDPLDAIRIDSHSVPNQGGMVTIDENDSLLLYTPAPGFEGVESFQYTIVDGFGLSDTATVTVAVAQPWAVQFNFVVDDQSRVKIAPVDGVVTVNVGDTFWLNVVVQDVRRDINELQQIKLNSSTTGGTFTLSLGGEVTSAISYNASADDLQSALEALSAIGSSNVAVTRNTDGAWIVEFVGDLSLQDVELIEADGTGLTGGTDAGLVVNDLRGVSAAYLDVLYDATLISTAGDIVHGLDYGNFIRGNVDSPGVIFGAGGAQNDFFVPVGGDLIVLFSIPLTADLIGQHTIVGDEGTGNEIVTFAPFGIIERENVDFGSLTLKIDPEDDTAAFGDNYQVAEDSPPTVLDVLSNDRLGIDGVELTIVDITGPDRGGTAVVAQGDRSLLYTPAPDFFGAETFSYTISDGADGTAAAEVTVNVTEVNDSPVASNDEVVTVQGSTLNIALSELVANDSAGPDNESTQILILDVIETMADMSEVLTSDTLGTVAIDDNGTADPTDDFIVYTPPTDYLGTDEFVYRVIDNGQTNGIQDGRVSNWAKVIVDITPAPPSVVGRVYIDGNDNGMFDEGEMAIAGVVVTLDGVDLGGNPVLQQSTMTAADGAYSFDFVGLSSYTITQQQPRFLLDGHEQVGMQGGNVDEDGRIHSVVTENQSIATGNDFLERGFHPDFLSIADLLSSTTDDGMIVALDSNGDVRWFTLTGGWEGYSAVELDVDADRRVAHLKVTRDDGSQSTQNVGYSGYPSFRIKGENEQGMMVRIVGAAADFGISLSQGLVGDNQPIGSNQPTEENVATSNGNGTDGGFANFATAVDLILASGT